ncbi:MAG: MFS transporter, partial [Thermoplasmata archaeon]
MDKKESYLILSYLSINHALTHSALIAFAPLLPFIIESGIGLSIDRGLLFAGISLLSYGLGSIPAGYLADRVGNFKILLIGVFLTTFSCLGLYFSRSQDEILVYITVLGFASALYHPPGLSVLSQAFKVGRGSAMGIHGAVGNLGQILTPIIAVLLAQKFFWQSFYLFLAVFAFLLCIVAVFFILSKTKERIDEVKRERSNKRNNNIEYNSKAKGIFTSTLANIMLLLAFTSLYYQGTIYVLPTYIVNVYHASKETSGYLTSLLLAAGVLGSIVGGKVEDKFGIKKPLFILTFVALFSFIPISLHSFELLIFGLVALGFAFFSTQPLTNSLIAEVSEKEVRGFYYGVTFLTRDGLGIIPLLLMGTVSNMFGIGAAIYVSLLFAVLALVSTFFIS